MIKNNSAIILGKILHNWSDWARKVNQVEDGWQSFFPEWASLIEHAKELMPVQNLVDEEFAMLELCWRITEEDESLADFAKANLADCWTNILRLTDSCHPEVRWQVYEVMGTAGKQSETFLRKGLQDEDAYCRRRAILSLARVGPNDADEIACRFSNDPDPYIRQAAKELARCSKK